MDVREAVCLVLQTRMLKRCAKRSYVCTSWYSSVYAGIIVFVFKVRYSVTHTGSLFCLPPLPVFSLQSAIERPESSNLHNVLLSF